MKKKEFITQKQRDKFNYICSFNKITLQQAALKLLINPYFLERLLLGIYPITKQEKEMFKRKGFDLWN